MVDLENFYRNVKLFIDLNHPLGQRMKPLLDEVVKGLPNEKQFQMKGRITFMTRTQAIHYWNTLKPMVGYGPDMRPYDRDGNCTYWMSEKVESCVFIITIIVDDLNERSDDYIKGLFAHEISEMSYYWRVFQSEKEKLLSLSPKARQVRMNQLTKQNAVPGSAEYKEHEDAVNKEASRLGFSKEIEALDACLTNR